MEARFVKYFLFRNAFYKKFFLKMVHYKGGEFMKTIQVIYLESETCGVCHALQPRVEEVTEQEGIALEVINVTQHPEVASQYQVLTVPVAIVFVGEREFARQARFIDMKLFEKQLQQAKEFAQMEDYSS